MVVGPFDSHSLLGWVAVTGCPAAKAIAIAAEQWDKRHVGQQQGAAGVQHEQPSCCSHRAGIRGCSCEAFGLCVSRILLLYVCSTADHVNAVVLIAAVVCDRQCAIARPFLVCVSVCCLQVAQHVLI